MIWFIKSKHRQTFEIKVVPNRQVSNDRSQIDRSQMKWSQMNGLKSNGLNCLHTIFQYYRFSSLA